MECKCETCVRKDCADRTKQDDLRMVIACSDYLNTERQMTNADRIRAMTDEELAKMFDEYVHCGKCPVREKCETLHSQCVNHLIKWLKQPAEEDA